MICRTTQPLRQLTRCLVFAGLILACSDDSGTPTSSETDQDARVDAGASTGTVDTAIGDGGSGSADDTSSAPENNASVTDASEDDNSDVLLEDGFSRPDASNTPDASSSGEILEGSQDCLRYILESQSTVFTLKLDNFFVAYEIRNQCNRPIRVRTQHFSDMFPVGLLKNGQPWLFFPDCPGTGDPVERVLNPGDGWRRGWFWRADDHEARLEQCGLEFEPDAQYALVGFGLTEVPPTGSDVWSEIYTLTDTIDITLVTR